jgi:hypothetical protein
LLSGDLLQSVDLTADTFNGPGDLEQTVATTPGTDYVLTFQLGVYPGSAVYSGPLRVRVTAGSVTTEFQHDAPAPVVGGVWQSFALPFRAGDTKTRIRFQNLQANQWCGLDRVAIAEVSSATLPPDFTLVSSSIDGGGAGASDEHGFSLSATIGQPDAGVLEVGGVHLFGGYWGPGQSLHLAREGQFVRVSWDFGLGFGELETTAALGGRSESDAWTPVSIAGYAASVLFPANGPARFFRIREN